MGFFFFHSLVSIDSLEPVCVFSLSWRWFVHALLSLWVVDRRSRGSFAPPPTPPCLGLGSWCFVTTLTNSVGLSSLCAVVATHFDLVCCCFFSVFFWKLQFSFFRRAAGTTKGIFARRSKLMASQSDLLASFVFWCPAARGRGNTAPFSTM